eukprot:CAMPEP_0119051756 /NCGR_PEP_ID=MMETSP1177-20130426/73270_1 /TAXON_ID=2985 /ORGANISM="Ochromonas sp, Strain CCMP1899" /LENGTH=622 /DNA_ID=CAMNT_0007031073 /DNA_START=89 /DNA_END=1954 /DNA_ORIENTATION=-
MSKIRFKNHHAKIKIKMRYYVKTAAFAILIGGYTIYNLVIDSTAASNLSKGLLVAQPAISDMVLYRDLYRRNLNDRRNLNEIGGISEMGSGEHEHVSRKLCKPPADPKYTAVFYAIAVLYLLIALAIVCDDFFCPSLDVLADWMNLSPDVSGATLMAAGSSAPELFTSAVGTFQRSDVGFGTVVGSAVFNVLFVVGICVLVTKIPLKITWWPLMRDSVFYLITIVVLAIFFGVNSPNVIEFWESLILVLMYFVYVTVMYFNERLYRFFSKLLKQNHSKIGISLDASVSAKEKQEEAEDDFNNLSYETGQFRTGILNIMMTDKSLLECAGTAMVSRISGSLEEVFKKFDTDKSGQIDAAELRALFEMLHCDIDDSSMTTAMASLDKDQNGLIDLQEFTLWWISSESRMKAEVTKCFESIDLDNNGFISTDEINILLQKLGHPRVAEGVLRIALAEVGGSTACNLSLLEFRTWYEKSLFWAAHKERAEVEAEASEGMSLSPPWEGSCGTWFFYILTFPIVLLFWATVPDVRKNGSRQYALIAFIMSLVYMGVISYFMVDFAEIIGATAGIPSVIMGLTFLAAGTSVPDMLSAIIVAQQGFGDKAVSSTLGSNVFDINIGLGLPW